MFSGQRQRGGGAAFTLAIPRPMPEEAPVTRQSLPASMLGSEARLGRGRVREEALHLGLAGTEVPHAPRALRARDRPRPRNLPAADFQNVLHHCACALCHFGLQLSLFHGDFKVLLELRMTHPGSPVPMDRAAVGEVKLARVRWEGSAVRSALLAHQPSSPPPRPMQQLATLLLLCAAAACRAEAPCDTDEDCSLNGVCTAGECACDKGWLSAAFTGKGAC